MTDDEIVTHLKAQTVNILAEARAAIDEGRITDAERCLELAEHYDRRAGSSRMILALRGEIQLQAGRPGEAVVTAKRLVADNPRSAVGKELLGKALLLSGDWNEAEPSFESVLHGPASEPTRRRATDYMAVIAGLKAYARGDVKNGHACWKEISNPEIRAAVDSALERVRADRLGG
jgi:predicted Zn-dependent protease